MAKYIIDFFNKIGIEPFYGVTFLFLLLNLAYLKEYKNWKNKKYPEWKKNLAIITLAFSVLMLLISIVHFFSSL